MAAKKTKVKAAATTKPSTGKPASATGASSKPAAKKVAPTKVALTKPPAKSAAAKATAGKPVALQTIAKKSTSSKAAGKKPVKTSKANAQGAALNGSAQSAIESSKPTDSETFYFVVGHMDAQISNQRLPSAHEIASSDSFDEVKDKAVDHLIELVDLLERRLWEIKRAQDFASYLALRELS
jgi:hypothetical protein